MIGIKCRSGRFFSACINNCVDAEWKLQEAYYKAQDCVVEESEEIRLSECDCEHCQSLEHNFEVLIEEIYNNGEFKN